MAIVKFKSGSKNNIASNITPINAGTVYFAIDENNKGSIYFDKDSTTRVVMSEAYAEYAERANVAIYDDINHYIKDYLYTAELDENNPTTFIFTSGRGTTTTLTVNSGIIRRWNSST